MSDEPEMTDDQRRHLARIIGADPDASPREILKMFVTTLTPDQMKLLRQTVENMQLDQAVEDGTLAEPENAKRVYFGCTSMKQLVAILADGFEDRDTTVMGDQVGVLVVDKAIDPDAEMFLAGYIPAELFNQHRYGDEAAVLPLDGINSYRWTPTPA